MNSLKVPIIIECGLNPVFVKACRNLVEKNIQTLKDLDFQQRKDTLQKLWEINYSSKMDWNYIEFNDSSSMLLFMLKWRGS
jgi:hypothetical protein